MITVLTVPMSSKEPMRLLVFQNLIIVETGKVSTIFEETPSQQGNGSGGFHDNLLIAHSEESHTTYVF